MLRSREAGLLACLCAGIAVPAQQGSSATSVREVVLERPAGTRETFYRIDLDPERQAEPIGIARWLSGPDPEEAGGWRVESDVLFLADGTRVLHTEHLAPADRKLVWREIRPRSGRTVRVDWPADGPAVSVESAGGPIRHRELDAGSRALFPLALVELVRAGAEAPGRCAVFQPLANAFEVLEARTLVAADVAADAGEQGAQGTERVLELARANGDLAGRFRFRGAELVEFRWQEGGAVATPVERTEYERLRALLPEEP